MATMRNLDALSREASNTLVQYKAGLNYHRQAGFQKDWPLYEQMKAGEQWPPPTEKTRSLPRPVFNIIDLIESLKVSTVMSEQIMMRFAGQESDDDQATEGGTLFSKMADSTWERIKQNELNEAMLDICANTGTGIVHYYWDDTYTGGKKLRFKGHMCGEELDPIDVFFGNPQQRNVQKQLDIVIAYRDMVQTVKEEAKAAGLSKKLVELITPDDAKVDQGYQMAQIEVQDTQKTTVLLHYRRGTDGLIYFKKIAAGIVIKPETSTGMKLYPLAVMQWKRRRKSIHGVGDTQGLIPNQKSINFLIAMSILSAQLTGWPKMAIDPKRVSKSKITNTPGEVVEVGSGELGLDSAIKFLNPGQISPHVNNLVTQIIDLTRSMTSANEASTGQAPGANMSAAALMQLQKANGVPIEGVKRRFYQFIEDVGRIWEEFFKVKYNLPRQMKAKDAMGEDETVTFHGSKYKDVDMDLKVDVGPSSSYSEALMMASLDRFLDKNYITFDQYLKYAPANVVPFRERLSKEIELQKEEAANAAANTPPANVAPADPMANISPEDRAKFDQLPPNIQQQILQQAQMGQGG